MIRTLAIATAAILAVGLTGTNSATAQDFPTQPITWVSPWNPGGANDILSRSIAPLVAETLGQPVTVMNRPGASGTIGSASVATAGDQGYSVVLGSTPTHATAPHIYSGLPYDPATDFAPVTLVGVVPNVLIVSADLPVDTVEELIEYAGQRPGELNFYSTGPGTSQHLSAELFSVMTNIQMEHVPYTGSAPALVDLLAGRIDLAFDNLNTVLSHIEAGSVKALGVTTSQRSSALPDVPTIAEAGVDGYDASVWFGVFAEPNTPDEHLSILNNAIVSALESPQLAETLAGLGVEVITNSPADFKAYQLNEIERWGDVVQAAGVEKQ